MGRLWFAPAAMLDIEELGQRIQNDDPRAALRFVQRIRHTCELIAKQPMMGRDRSDLVSDLRSFPVGNYLVFYGTTGSDVEILRVVHGSRDLNAVFDSSLGVE